MLHCVIASDFHLEGMQKVLKNPLPYQIREIDKVYQYALSNSIEHLIVPGDLTHVPNMTDDTLLALITMLLKMDDSVKTWYIAGNHDLESVKSSSLDVLSAIAEAGFFKNFQVFKQPAVKKIEGINVAFMPFPHTVVPECSKPPLVIAHVETAGAGSIVMGDNGRQLRGGHDSGLSRQPGDFLVSGHIHQHQFLKKHRAIFVGSLYQTNFGEALPKGFLDLTAKYSNGKLAVSFEHINSNPNFILETKIVSSNEDWKDLEDNGSVKYKILVEEGLVVPKKITDQLKNIISITGLTKKSKVATDDVLEAVTSANNLPTFKITTGLKHYLKQAGHDPKQLKRAQSLAREAASHLGLGR